MLFKVIVIDNEPHAIEALLQTFETIPEVKVAATFTAAAPAIDYVYHNDDIDVVFCDIEMPELNGIAAAGSLTRYADYLIFTTSYPEFSREAYQEGVDALLEKPVDDLQVRLKLRKLQRLRRGSIPVGVRRRFLIKTGRGDQYTGVDIHKLYALTSNGDYVNLHTPATTLMTHSSLVAALDYLEDTKLFVQVNRTTVISLLALSQAKYSTVYLDNNTTYQISRAYKASFKTFCLENLLQADNRARAAAPLNNKHGEILPETKALG